MYSVTFYDLQKPVDSSAYSFEHLTTQVVASTWTNRQANELNDYPVDEVVSTELGSLWRETAGADGRWNQPHSTGVVE